MMKMVVFGLAGLFLAGCSADVEVDNSKSVEKRRSVEEAKGDEKPHTPTAEELREAKRDKEEASYSKTNAAPLSVAFPESELKIEGERISGSAVVLTIKPLSFIYDPHTRRGKVSVRFNPDQFEAARAWIRKNIETLARDKNIAPVTGQLPPAATYYSLSEKVEGNVMEVEFRTE